MSILEETGKNCEKVVISGINNLFSKIYLTPLLKQSRVFWLCFKNNYELQQAKELFNWQQKNFSANPAELLIWPEKDELNPQQIWQIFISPNLICLTTVNNLESKIIEQKKFQQELITLRLNQPYQPIELKTQLILAGYELNNYVDQPGLVSHRGEILDVWSAQLPQPLRLQFTGNQLTKINYFDPISKKLATSLKQVIILPRSLKSAAQQNLIASLNHEHQLLSGENLTNSSILKNWRTVYQLQNLATVTPAFQETPFFHSQFSELKKYLNKHPDWNINFITQDRKKIKDLSQQLNLPAAKIWEFPLFTFKGLADLERQQLWLTDQDIFKAETTDRAKKLARTFVTDYQIGDYVVHREHGIAKLTKTTTQTIDGISREYFLLQYKDNDRLYLPIEQANKISKYLGANKPKLHRLGAASTWPQVVRKLKEDIIKTAQELLNLYARRQLSQAKPLRPHPLEENRLADDFPYQETTDQLRALTETLTDLASDRPADRLICGDVGFGKTEIAIRAAWRAVLNGQQVVLLCPTTILAQQHFDTFSARFKNYPVKIASLSRFSEHQKSLSQEIATGAVDIVIGTHRLLSKDVKFNKVGLIIIDEEQQFGVADKEKLKELKTSAHILTLSATPIPRTLNLSLSNVRDISIIATPPQGRRPIKTTIQQFSANTIVQAIQTEIKRGGQTYYLYNKVETINEQKHWLEQLLPQVRFAIIHGQLPAAVIAQTMHEFDAGKIDVLICSTIIANGLDLPNVNTLIVDGAQNFGLAQLYQIRGRIGRSERQAFAYFLYHSEKLKGQAAARLQALQEAETLGSGFQIALRDMEIRGIGNILGKKQHGKVALVGLSLYNELIAQTVAEIKTGVIPTPLIDTTVDLPLRIGLPIDFIEDEVKRLRFYQLLTNSENLSELDQHFARLPRPWPATVKNLRYVLEIKILARAAAITSIDTQLLANQEKKLIITWSEEIDYEKISHLLRHNPAWEFGSHDLKINLTKLGADWQNELRQTIELFNKNLENNKKREEIN